MSFLCISSSLFYYGNQQNYSDDKVHSCQNYSENEDFYVIYLASCPPLLWKPSHQNQGLDTGH